MSKKPFPFSVCKDCCATGGGVDNDYINNNFANAVKKTVSGKGIFVTDVSPIEHEISVKLKSDTVTDFSDVDIIFHNKNYSQHCFTHGYTREKNGVTFSGNDDYSISINGTATDYIWADIFNIPTGGVVDGTHNFSLPYGTYTFSGMENLPNGATLVVLRSVGGAVYVNQEPVTFYLQGFISAICLEIEKGTVLDNVVIRPQLEPGREATEYEPTSWQCYHGIASLESATPIIASKYIDICTRNDDVMLEVEYNKNITFSNTAELIEEITVEEGVRAIIRNATPDGVPYNYKSMYVSYEIKPCNITGVVLLEVFNSPFIEDATFSRLIGSQASFSSATTSGRFFDTWIEVIGGMWTGIINSTIIQGNNPTNVQTRRSNKPYNGETIKALRIRGSEQDLEAGAVIKIYGVRA